MKKLLVFLLLFSSAFTYSQNSKPIKLDYVEFMTSGPISSKYFRPIFLSCDTLKVVLNDDDRRLYNALKAQWKISENDFIDMQYKFIITDTSTYKMVLRFINDNKQFYSARGEYQYGYIVFTPQKLYFVDSKVSYRYFLRLEGLLIKEKCDNKVVKNLPFK